MTFLLTGARLREIVQLDKADIDLHQSTVRLHRKGGDINILPLADFGQNRTQSVPKAAKEEEPGKGTIYILPESKNFTWGGLESGEEIFQEMPTKNAWHGTTRFAAYLCDTTFRPRRKSQGHSESYEPQKSGNDSTVFAFAKPRAGKSRERSEAVGRLK